MTKHMIDCPMHGWVPAARPALEDLNRPTVCPLCESSEVIGLCISGERQPKSAAMTWSYGRNKRDR